MRALITMPEDVIPHRLAFRTTNDFGKDPAELERTLRRIDEIEPRLRRATTVAIDTTAPVTTSISAIHHSLR